jgi:hypothetical protein
MRRREGTSPAATLGTMSGFRQRQRTPTREDSRVATATGRERRRCGGSGLERDPDSGEEVRPDGRLEPTGLRCCDGYPAPDKWHFGNLGRWCCSSALGDHEKEVAAL